MKILMFGAGAMGTFLAGVLSKENYVAIYGRGEKIRAVEIHGIRITGITEISTTVKTVDDPDSLNSEQYDLIVLAVKSYDTDPALQILKQVKSTPVLSLQNGLDNEVKIAEAVGIQRTLGGVTSHGVTYIGPGVVHHAGIGETIVGEMDGSETERISNIAQTLSSAGIETKVSSEIKREIWIKGIVNAGINPITALEGLENGYLLKLPGLERLLEKTCRECIVVAEAVEIDLGDCDVIEKTKNVAKLTAKNKSSMLQDVEMGRRTEIDSINGKIVEIGNTHQIRTPVNSTLVALIKGIGKGR
jgi:2-dehydropantoate 2-reductase